MNSPNQFKPTSAEDFVGPAARHAQVILAKCDRLVASNDGNYRGLFYGPPGTGKSSLAQLVANRLTKNNQFAVQYSNGQSALVAKIREWTYESKLRSMFGDRRVMVIDECDAISEGALNEWRSFSDKIPPCYDIILTTNKTLKTLQPQLHSRSQNYSFGACPIVELAQWLERRWGMPFNPALMIANQVRGDVRAALNAVETALDECMAGV